MYMDRLPRTNLTFTDYITNLINSKTTRMSYIKTNLHYYFDPKDNQTTPVITSVDSLPEEYRKNNVTTYQDYIKRVEVFYRGKLNDYCHVFGVYLVDNTALFGLDLHEFISCQSIISKFFSYIEPTDYSYEFDAISKKYDPKLVELSWDETEYDAYIFFETALKRAYQAVFNGDGQDLDQPQTGISTPIFILIVLIVTALALGAIYFLYQKKNNNAGNSY